MIEDVQPKEPVILCCAPGFDYSFKIIEIAKKLDKNLT